MKKELLGYTVVDINRRPRTRRRHLQVAMTERGARLWATAPGDAVVRVYIDVNEQPVHISGEVL